MPIQRGIAPHAQEWPNDCFIAQLMMVESAVTLNPNFSRREQAMASEAVRRRILRPDGVSTFNVPDDELKRFIESNAALYAEINPNFTNPTPSRLSSRQRSPVELLCAFAQNKVGLLMFNQPDGSPDWPIMLGADILRPQESVGSMHMRWHVQHSDGTPAYSRSTTEFLTTAYGPETAVTPQLILLSPKPRQLP